MFFRNNGTSEVTFASPNEIFRRKEFHIQSTIQKVIKLSLRQFTHFVTKLFGFLVLSRSQRCFCIMHYSGTEQAMSQMEDILKCSFGFKREHKETTQNILPPLQKYRSQTRALNPHIEIKSKRSCKFNRFKSSLFFKGVHEKFTKVGKGETGVGVGQNWVASILNGPIQTQLIKTRFN